MNKKDILIAYKKKINLLKKYNFFTMRKVVLWFQIKFMIF
jgi:hypothetical protein